MIVLSFVFIYFNAEKTACQYLNKYFVGNVCKKYVALFIILSNNVENKLFFGGNMKIDRLVGILSILLQREKVTVRELAELYEVSERTVYRDIDALGMAGIPIASERGNGGGVYIMEKYKIDRTLLSTKEMHAVLDGLRSLDSVSNTNYYSRLMEKFSAGSSMSAASKNIIIDLSGWDKSAVAEKIEIIKNAIENKEKISFGYHSPSRRRSR